jgi:hypothetical protein
MTCCLIGGVLGDMSAFDLGTIASLTLDGIVGVWITRALMGHIPGYSQRMKEPRQKVNYVTTTRSISLMSSSLNKAPLSKLRLTFCKAAAFKA